MLATANLMEHRRKLRKDTNVLVKFRPEAYKTEEKFAVILDINDLGAALFAYSLLPVGTKIIIDKGDDLLTKAEIVSVGFDKDSDMIRFGVSFLKENETTN
jgi:hypothetical protein